MSRWSYKYTGWWMHMTQNWFTCIFRLFINKNVYLVVVVFFFFVQMQFILSEIDGLLGNSAKKKMTLSIRKPFSIQPYSCQQTLGTSNPCPCLYFHWIWATMYVQSQPSVQWKAAWVIKLPLAQLLALQSLTAAARSGIKSASSALLDLTLLHEDKIAWKWLLWQFFYRFWSRLQQVRLCISDMRDQI